MEQTSWTDALTSANIAHTVTDDAIRVTIGEDYYLEVSTPWQDGQPRDGEEALVVAYYCDRPEESWEPETPSALVSIVLDVRRAYSYSNREG